MSPFGRHCQARMGAARMADTAHTLACDIQRLSGALEARVQSEGARACAKCSDARIGVQVRREVRHLVQARAHLRTAEAAKTSQQARFSSVRLL